MNPKPISRAIADLWTTTPAHIEPTRGSLIRPLVFLILLSALALAPFVLHKIAS